MKFKYITTSKAVKEVVWLRKFLLGLRVVPLVESSLVMFCDNNKVVAQCKEPRNHWNGKHIVRKNYLIREIVMRGDMVVKKITSIKNLIDPFTKTLSTRVFDGHRIA